MAALFGILGSHPRQHAETMADALQHRAQPGSQTVIEALQGDAGWFGVIAKDASDQIGSDPQGRLVACHAEVYDEDEQASSRDAISRVIDGDTDAITTLDAQFSAARWDGESLTVVTDSMGTVPLYWAVLENGSGLAFASEYKALCTLPGVNATLDREMAGCLQYHKSLPIGRTLAQGIHCFGPGQVLRFDRKGKTLDQRAFGAVTTKTSVRGYQQAVDLTAEALRGAVWRRSQDLDPVGLCLSGGIDSIVVAFLLRDLYPDRTIHTFCSGSTMDDHECVTARQVAADIKSEHHDVLTPPELLSTHLEPLCWHLEDPYARSETLQLRECARAAKAAGVDTLLVAQGADDLFAGMPKCRLLWMMKKAAFFPPVTKGFWEFYSFTQTNAPTRTPLGRLMRKLKYKGKLPAPPVVIGSGFTPEHMPTPIVGPDMINNLLGEQFQGSTHKSAKKMERVFASFGVQYRSPFHDRALTQVGFSIDEKLKVTRKEQKFILRETIQKWVPERYIRIPKFPQRMAYNVQFAEQIDKVFEQYLSAERVAELGVFEPETIATLKRTDTSSAYKDEAAMRIWTAAMTHIWVQHFAPERSGTNPKPHQEEAHGQENIAS